MSWWESGVAVDELDPALSLGELSASSNVDGIVPRGVSLAEVLRSRPEPAAPAGPVELPYDPTRTASARLGELAGCPSGYGVLYATPEYGDTLYTRKCRAVEATSAADIIRETQGGVGDQVLTTLFPTTPPGSECAALDLACHLRGLRPYFVGGALLGGLFVVAYIVRAFR